MYRAVIVIPDENILNVGVYSKQLTDNEFHGAGVKYFSNRYKLGITAESLGLEDDEYPGYVWQSKLASMKHVLICISDCELSTIYLPDRISNGQYNWFLDNKRLLNKRIENLSYMVVDSDENILEKGSSYNKPDVLFSLYECLERRNTLNESEDLKL